MTNDVVETPMMKQFFDIKRKYPDAVLLFRCGDFYETYSTDAVECAGILGITPETDLSGCTPMPGAGSLIP